MDLSLDESQEILSQTFSDLLARECPTSRVRESEASGFSRALWDRYVELGAACMGLPESVGGLGMGLLELGLVAACSGRALAPVPFVEVSVAGRSLARLAPEDALLGQVAEGETAISFAPPRPNAVRGTTRPAEAGSLIAFGSIVDHVIGLDGDELVLVSGEARRITPRLHDLGSGATALWDLSDRGEGPRRVLASGPAARESLARAAAEWKLLSAFWLVGLAQRALAIGAAYAKERIQFGVPIGSFQAIAHPLADCATRVDGAELLAQQAAWADEAEPERFEALASMAFVWAAQTAQRSAGISLHTHGGYGFSLEYDIQLYYRRACAVASMGGGAREELMTVADHCARGLEDDGTTSTGLSGAPGLPGKEA